MLKQGVVQEKLSDLTSMNQLPPLGTLPQWSRVNTLNRGGYPKPFTKDKLAPVPDKSGEESDERQINLSELNPTQRIQHLERSIIFLKQQHAEVLKSLHDEIDNLKTENKDLQFKIVMSQKQQHHHHQQHNGGEGNVSASSRRSRTGKEGRYLEKEDKLDELKIIFLEEEIKELKHALREARNRNSYLTQLVEQSEEVKKKQAHTIDTMKVQLSQGNAAHLAEQITSGTSLFNLPGGRQPTLPECEAIIRRLQQINEQQQHELENLKSDLRDVLYSHKWTPDAYLLAKAYVAEEESTGKEGADKSLPKLTMKNPTRKLPEIAYIQRDSVNLPALKQTVSNQAMERKKRTQILQKARLKKEILP
ncbi:coiled-coil domain-containing protein 74B-like [Dreissena polymorpha]|uniref:coiled-coil domain-containing protein 74B-like n=1 Tax=Dreissena polymorpha TaxID=45954 RepID=UPI002264330C|nr:coiled-coil domain-containing protein 74B-like [Dreissena polymorpha]XP_052270343.1 coiled-coil domain-containing protein 74B-like [Dreissena polymorpha]